MTTESIGEVRRGSTRYLAAAFSVVVALIHLLVVPEHFEEWGYGAFFLLAPPGPGDFSCPSGQTLSGPTNVSYTDIVLTDITSGASIPLGSAS